MQRSEEGPSNHAYEGEPWEHRVTQSVSAQGKEKEEVQHHHNFHTRCLVRKKVYFMSVDGESCISMASINMVRKLNLPTVKHPRPYKRLTECGEVEMNEQALITFSIGRYKDEISCDVVPMHTAYILLEGPWLVNRQVTYNGYYHKHSLVLHKRKFNLVPLTLDQILKDQGTLHKIEKERKEEERKKEESEKEKREKEEIEKEKREKENSENEERKKRK